MTDGLYPLIADYGVIGDGRSIALVSRSGSIDWWCLPSFDGDPVFARILDAKLGGSFSIHPIEPFRTTRAYLGETNLLATEFRTAYGAVRLLDFMPALTEAQKLEFPVPFREIVRRVEGIDGDVTVRVEVRVRPHYGTTTPRIRYLGSHRFSISWGNQALHLASSHPLDCVGKTLVGTFPVRAGERIDFALAYSPEAPADLPILHYLDVVHDLTESFWTTWAATCTYTGPYREAVLRSALALKLLTYAPSGAIIAAPTTSLPERIGGTRNWDYRYCWPRDAAFTIRALLSLGYVREANAFADWLLHSTRITHPALKVLYNIYGDRPAPERTLPYLHGYRGNRPVRTGNAARGQFQLDIYGEIFDAFALYRRSGGLFDRDARRLIRGAAKIVMREWAKPDDGIWEIRLARKQHVHSKIMAWVALERTIEMARSEDFRLDLRGVRATSDAIKRWVLDRGYDPELGAFVRAPGTRELDAALLAIPLVDFLPGSDPRVVGTIDAIRTHLSRGDLVYRYLGPDGIPGGEGAFVICSFWLVEALAHIGRIDEAHEIFERVLHRRNDLGLLSEEIDPETGEFLGNFPQAFSHIGLINAALTLSRHTR